MPLVGWFIGFLETRIGSLIVAACLSMGFSFTAYKFTIAPLRAFIVSQTSGAPSMATQIIGFLGFDKAITILLSAVAAKYAVGGIQSILSRRKG